ncbi:ABC transporter substrate-binding protein [Achromobacter sp. K91]|uniref:ABC transporter substrate-binding protein n=2 Tax=Achromobacter aegrifaciens TaxID=1287736 RepID=A0AAD2KKZ9_ACHAE|nr:MULTISPECIES: ABC transporter substrate-binding protein [Achromobacter]PTN51216.1 ABC transporter substrate-binding protein [Achromobacter xylosoxidans]MBD9385520.1 ABC transporter substrate-binding protein [Achromobacter sp. ACM02]MBD9417956.1 ABC transporter substrate-binding protein [Achromobacter sp. ACM04]MDQ1764377.1 ABC transporter substrate-binding protein [Achromobacter aegrifaciens]MDR7949555.1 ABC transporter substrate-binding protein [Achromobacter aegrifaciens]
MQAYARGLSALAAVAALTVANAAMADIRIGFTGVLSGPQAALGQDQYDGLMLGIEQLGGSLGGQKAVVIRDDDQLKPDVGAQIVQKFIEKDKVDVIVGLGFSNVLMAELRRIKESGVVALSTNAGPAPIAGRMCLPNLFVLGWQNDSMSEAMGKYVKDQGYKRAYLMSSNYQAGKDKLAGFKRFYGAAPADEIYTQLGQLDYSAEISRMQSASPDALFVFYTGGVGVNFVRQLRQAGLMEKLPFFSESLIDSNTLTALKEQAVGAIYGTPWATTLDNPQNRKFVEAFKAKYGRLPSEYAVGGYDAAFLLDTAIKQQGGKVGDSKALAAAVKAAGANFPTVRGKFRFNSNNMPVQDLYAYQVVKEGDGVGLKQLAKVFTDHQDAYVADCPLK